MKKKEYIIPVTAAVSVETMQMIAYSGESNVGIKVKSEADDSDNDSRSRRSFNSWDDDEEDSDY